MNNNFLRVSQETITFLVYKKSKKFLIYSLKNWSYRKVKEIHGTFITNYLFFNAQLLSQIINIYKRE